MKRLGYKRYSEYCLARIRKCIEDNWDNDGSILYIVFNGQRPNNKHFKGVKLLTNVSITSLK